MYKIINGSPRYRRYTLRKLHFFLDFFNNHKLFSLFVFVRLPGDEDAGEVVGPGEVKVDRVADNAQRHREEGGHEDGPVLVGQQVLLKPSIRGPSQGKT